MDLDTLSRGDRVVVDPESEHRDEQEARVLKLPPEEHRVPGGTEELDGEALVEYPNTTGGAMGGLLGDMQEVVDADEIVRKA